jgi:hypothetical protein
MRGKRLSDDMVKAIYTHHDSGKSQRQIAKDLWITLCAVQGALYRRSGHTLKQKKIKLGRGRCTSSATDAAIHLYIKRHRFDSNSSIATAFKVSRDTIWRRSIESNLRSRLAFRDYLRKHHKTARRNWCISNRRTDFSKWIFSMNPTLFSLIAVHLHGYTFTETKMRSTAALVYCQHLPVTAVI